MIESLMILAYHTFKYTVQCPLQRTRRNLFSLGSKRRRHMAASTCVFDIFSSPKINFYKLRVPPHYNARIEIARITLFAKHYLAHLLLLKAIWAILSTGLYWLFR